MRVQGWEWEPRDQEARLGMGMRIHSWEWGPRAENGDPGLGVGTQGLGGSSKTWIEGSGLRRLIHDLE